jgi:hypothetical protein
MTRIILLSQAIHAETLREQHPDWLATGVIVSIDIDVSVLLEQWNYSFVEITELLTAVELRNLWKTAHKLSQTWYQGLKGVSAAGYDAVLADYHMNYLFFGIVLITGEVFFRVSGRYAVSSTVIFKSHQHPLILWDAYSSDIIYAVWQYLAEQVGFKIDPAFAPHSLHKPPMRGSHKLIYKTKRLLGVIRNWITNPLLWRITFRQEHIPYLFFLSKRETPRYNEIVNEVERHLQEKLQRFTTDHFNRAEYDTATWQPIPTWLPEIKRLMWTKWGTDLYERWRQLRTSQQEVYPHLFNNPYLDFQFTYFFRVRLPRAAQAYEFAYDILKILKPKAITVSVSPIDFHAHIIAAAHSLKIPVMTVPHSGIPHEGWDCVFGAKNIVWTNDYVALWASEQTPPSRFVVSGLPREIVASAYVQPTPNSPPSKKIILVLLVRLSRYWQSGIEFAAHRRALFTLAHVPDGLKDTVEVIFKPHPSDDHQYLYQHVGAQIVRDTSTLDWVKRADLCVIVNVPTSAYLYPLMEQKPLVFINNAGDIKESFIFGEWCPDAVIKDEASIWPKLNEILSSTQSKNEIIQANQKFWAQMNDGIHDTPEAIIANTLRNLKAD